MRWLGIIRLTALTRSDWTAGALEDKPLVVLLALWRARGVPCFLLSWTLCVRARAWQAVGQRAVPTKILVPIIPIRLARSGEVVSEPKSYIAMNNNRNKYAPLIRYIGMVVAVFFSFYAERIIDRLSNPFVRQAIIVFLIAYLIFTAVEFSWRRLIKRNAKHPNG